MIVATAAPDAKKSLSTDAILTGYFTFWPYSSLLDYLLQTTIYFYFYL